ncbi:MAG: TonB-dependent receptor [Bacteroidaceae bacterium]|nr:TonB-dependent receptor [Bacteroidaceae bacterium]
MVINILLAALLCVNDNEVVNNTDTTSRNYALEEVVVSDFKTNKKDLVPISRTAMSYRQLSNQQITGLRELSAIIPNFYMPDYGSRASCPVYVRGVGNKSDGTGVAFYIDGVPYYEPLSFDTDLGDVASVEVLRGPQGTLYGRNAIGGIININTHNPIDYQNTRVKVGYGRYNDVRTQVSNYTKVNDKFGFTVGAVYHHNDGAFTNKYLNEKVDKMDETEERIGLYWQPSINWQLRLTSNFKYSDQGGYPYAPVDEATNTLQEISYNRPSTFRRLVSTNGLGVRYNGENISFNSQTSFQYINSHQAIDQDFTTTDKSFVNNKRNQNMVAEELTLKSNNYSRYQWVVGVFGMMEHVDREVDNESQIGGTNKHTDYCVPTSSFAIYHQSAYNIWRGLSATAGLRFDYEHAKTNYDNDVITLATGERKDEADFESSKNFKQFTPKFTLQYHTTKDNLFYGSITRGYKPGGFNKSFAKDSERSYEPEYSWNYEVGTRVNLFNNLLTVSADLFYIDWRDLQITTTVTGTGNITTNAGHADSKGGELSITARPIKGLQLNLNYGYTYARFLANKKSETSDYTGNRLPLVPNHTLSCNANYTIYPKGWADRMTFNVGMNGLGRIYWAVDNQVYQNFYTLLNAKVAITKGMFTWEVWGKNLTDTEYMAYGFKSGNTNYAQDGKPLMFGTTIELNF